MNILLMYVIVLIGLTKSRTVLCVPVANLTIDLTTLEGEVCPTVVQFTCTIEDLSTLRWFSNDNSIAIYGYISSDTFPMTLSSPPGIEISVTSAAPDNVNPQLLDHATSTLTTNTTFLQVLNIKSITCGNFGTLSEPVTVNFNILGPPPPEISATCSLMTSASGLDASLQWSSSFNSQHAVERYRVSVDPDPSPSCSSDQVMPSEDYSCPGLSPERNYSITVSAINCGDQEGESDTFTVLPQLLTPQLPHDVQVTPDPGGLLVNWKESVTTSGNCSFSGAINYTLFLENSAGEVVEERVVSSDSSCTNVSCSSSFSLSSQICRVTVIGNNMFGESNPAFGDVILDRLTTSNQVLLVLGVMLLCGGVVVLIILTVLKVTEKGVIRFVLLMIGVGMIVVSIVLWVAVGLQVGLQDNTCDSVWQSTRNNLIISAFVFSLLSFLIIVAAHAIVGCQKYYVKRSRKLLSEIQEHSHGTGKSMLEYDESNVYTEVKIIKREEKKFTDYLSPIKTKQPVKTKQQVPTPEPAGHYYSPIGPGDVKEEEGDSREYASPRKEPAAGGSSVKMHPTEIAKTQLETSDLEDDKSKYDVGAGGRLAVLEDDMSEEHVKRGVPREDYVLELKEKRFNEYNKPKYDVGAGGRLAGLEDDMYEEHVKRGVPREDYAFELKEKRFNEYNKPLCVAMRKYTERRNPLPEQVAAWFPKDRKWPREDLSEDTQLKVSFMNKCPKSWKYKEASITREVIMEIVQMSWSDCFILEKEKNPHIRVEFQEQCRGSWSALGCESKLIDLPNPTMVLNFSNMSDEEDIKATIIHQFGHALGLGHALMKPNEWKDLKPCVNIEDVENFEVQWTGKKLKKSIVNYDKESVMRYSFNPLWLKRELPELSTNVQNLVFFKKQTDLSPDDRNILRVILFAPPKYELEPDHLLVVAGESPTIHFTVTSEYPMPKHPKHTIIREDSGTVRKDLFVIKGESINFPEVQVNDSGTYVISCHNNDGLEGRQSFKLTITPD